MPRKDMGIVEFWISAIIGSEGVQIAADSYQRLPGRGQFVSVILTRKVRDRAGRKAIGVGENWASVVKACLPAGCVGCVGATEKFDRFLLTNLVGGNPGQIKTFATTGRPVVKRRTSQINVTG